MEVPERWRKHRDGPANLRAAQWHGCHCGRLPGAGRLQGQAVASSRPTAQAICQCCHAAGPAGAADYRVAGAHVPLSDGGSQAAGERHHPPAPVYGGRHGASRAAIKTAETNLAYTQVLSPITGRTGRSSVTEGALVTADQTTSLVTVTQFDPI
jgi:multidrug efflux pump subunit AcrA (membrane-fusion protein)